MSIDNTTGALTLPYDWTTEEAARNAASSAKFQEQDDALRAGLNNLLVRGAVAGTANAVELTASNDVVALIRGMKVHFKALATSTAAATFNLNGTGALPLVKWTGSTYAALAAGDIVSGRRYDLTYDEASGGRWCVASASSAIGESLLSSPDATSARAAISAASLAGNQFTGDQNLGGNAAYNGALKEVTPSLNTSPTPNELTVDFRTGHKATHTVTGNRKIIPVFPANGGVGLLDLTNAGTATITFSAGKKTAGGASLTFTTSGTDRLTFIGTDGDYEVILRKDIKA